MGVDWTKIYKKYKGLWVALLEDEQTVVGSGETAREAFEAAREKGYTQTLLTQMPEDLISYVGGLRS